MKSIEAPWAVNSKADILCVGHYQSWGVHISHRRCSYQRNSLSALHICAFDKFPVTNRGPQGVQRIVDNETGM